MLMRRRASASRGWLRRCRQTPPSSCRALSSDWRWRYCGRRPCTRSRLRCTGTPADEHGAAALPSGGTGEVRAAAGVLCSRELRALNAAPEYSYYLEGDPTTAPLVGCTASQAALSLLTGEPRRRRRRWQWISGFPSSPSQAEAKTYTSSESRPFMTCPETKGTPRWQRPPDCLSQTCQ